MKAISLKAIAMAAGLLAASQSLANTWLYEIQTDLSYTAYMIEADDEGTPVENPWIFNFNWFNSKNKAGQGSKCITGLIQAGANTLLDFTLPAAPGSCYDGTILGFKTSGALNGQKGIKEVRFPVMPSVSFDVDSTFKGCTGLEKIVFTDDVRLTKVTFEGCTGLQEMVFEGVPFSYGPANGFTKGIPSGTFRVFIEQPDLWEAKFATFEVYDPATASGALSLANYQAKFNDGTTPSYVWRIGTSSGGSNPQWVTVKKVVAEDKKLRITGERTTDGSAVTYGTVVPEYRATGEDVSGELPLTCSATTTIAVDGNTRYEAYASVLSRQENTFWVDPVTNLGTSVSVELPNDGVYELKWLWRPVGYAVDVAYPEELGTVTATAPAADGLYDAGSIVTLTATPIGDAVFEKWAGDVGDADPTSATIEVTADQYRKIIPIFQGKTWWFTDGNKKLTDGYWTNTVTVTDDIITLSAFPTGNAFGNVTVLDFAKNKTLPAGYRIETIPVSFLSRNTAYGRIPCQAVTEVYLPDTIRSISGSAFQGQGTLRVFEPLLPRDLTYIASEAFLGCSSLQGTLVMGYAQTPVVFSGSSIFESAGIRHADLGPGVTNLCDTLFYKSSLETITLPSTLQAISRGALGLNNTAQIKEIRFKGGVPEIADNPFSNWAANKTLFLVPYGNASWNAILTDPEKVTPWGELDDEGLKATFKANFPEIRKPYGLLKSGALPSLAKDQWIVEWPLAGGTQIILR